MSDSEIRVQYCYNITYRYWIFIGHSNVNNVIVVCITGIFQNILPIPNNLHCSSFSEYKMRSHKKRFEWSFWLICKINSVLFCRNKCFFVPWCIVLTILHYIILSVFYFVLFLYYSPSSESVIGDRLWHSTLNRKRSC